MKIHLNKSNGEVNSLIIELDNGNTIFISPRDEYSISIENTSGEELGTNGFAIYPIDYSTIHITPEG
jgi:hypothetical protein